jgi:hypothetical protein
MDLKSRVKGCGLLRFQVVMAASMMTEFLDVAPCSLLEGCERLRLTFQKAVTSV